MARRKMSNEQNLLIALKDLTAFCTSGRRYETRNPYAVPEIIASLKTMAVAQGMDISGWMDANNDHLQR